MKGADRRLKIAAFADHWDRLIQIVKTEEPIAVAAIAKRCPDLGLREVDNTICEMIRAGVIHRKFDDSTGSIRELIGYGKCSE
jgi:hypothetical protein